MSWEKESLLSSLWDVYSFGNCLKKRNHYRDHFKNFTPLAIILNCRFYECFVNSSYVSFSYVVYVSSSPSLFMARPRTYLHRNIELKLRFKFAASNRKETRNIDSLEILLKLFCKVGTNSYTYTFPTIKGDITYIPTLSPFPFSPLLYLLSHGLRYFILPHLHISALIHSHQLLVVEFSSTSC